MRTVLAAALVALALSCGATTPKSDCSPACAAGSVCLKPGACQFDAKCVARADVSCPDAGLCSAPGCAGTLEGDSLSCVCR